MDTIVILNGKEYKIRVGSRWSYIWTAIDKAKARAEMDDMSAHYRKMEKESA